MKRRNVLTAVGTLALGVGTALGTGAVDVVSSNGDGSFRVVAPGADITITPVSNPTAPVEVVAESDQGIDFDTLEAGDLPKVVVHEGDGMVAIEVAVERGSNPGDLGEVFTVTNNSDSTTYDVGFEYIGYGSAVGSDGLTEQLVHDAFQLTTTDESGTEVVVSSSPYTAGRDPETLVGLDTVDGSGPNSKAISLSVDVSDSTISSALSFDGTLGADFDSKSLTLVDEVTAVATQQ